MQFGRVFYTLAIVLILLCAITGIHSTNTVARFHGHWTKHRETSDPWPEPRLSPAVFHDNSQSTTNIYMFGGCTRLAGLGCKEYANDLWKLDVTTLVWEHVATTGQIPSPRMWPMGAVVGNMLVLYGGIGPDGARVVQHGDVHILDLITKNWTRIEVPQEKMPPVRLLGTLQPYHDRFALLFGGTGGTSGAPKTKNDLWAFDTVTKSWGNGPLSIDQAEARAGHASAVRGDSLFIYGGRRYDNPNPAVYNSTIAFDLLAQKWRRVDTSTENPGARFTSSGGIVGNHQWLITSGSDPQDRSVDPSDVFSLDLDKGLWTKVESQSSERPKGRIYGAVMTSSSNRRLILFGGKDPDTNQILPEMWSFDLVD